MPQSEPRPAGDPRSSGRFLYAALTLALPLLVVAVGHLTLGLLVSRPFVWNLSGLVLDKLPGEFQGSVDPPLSAIADLTGRMRFGGPHAVFVVMAWTSVVVSLWAAWSMIADHLDARRANRGVALMIIGIVVVSLSVHLLVSTNPVRDIYFYVVTEALRRLGYSCDSGNEACALAVIVQMERRAGYGYLIGLGGAAALVGAAMVLAYRWSAPQWRDPDRLRRQMITVVVLFAVASTLLVFGNTAIRALHEWSVNILLPVENHPLADHMRGAAAALAYTFGVLSSAILIATFLPAFVSLKADIDRAARDALGAAEASRPTFKAIKEWKETNGLNLSTTEISTAVIAAAAPLLTSPAIDLTKVLVVPP